MDEELKQIVQRMIDAGESEGNIALVIQNFDRIAGKQEGVDNAAATAAPEEPQQQKKFDYLTEDLSIESKDPSSTGLKIKDRKGPSAIEKSKLDADKKIKDDFIIKNKTKSDIKSKISFEEFDNKEEEELLELLNKKGVLSGLSVNVSESTPGRDVLFLENAKKENIEIDLNSEYNRSKTQLAGGMSVDYNIDGKKSYEDFLDFISSSEAETPQAEKELFKTGYTAENGVVTGIRVEGAVPENAPQRLRGEYTDPVSLDQAEEVIGTLKGVITDKYYNSPIDFGIKTDILPDELTEIKDSAYKELKKLTDLKITKDSFQELYSKVEEEAISKAKELRDQKMELDLREFNDTEFLLKETSALEKNLTPREKQVSDLNRNSLKLQRDLQEIKSRKDGYENDKAYKNDLYNKQAELDRNRLAQQNIINRTRTVTKMAGMPGEKFRETYEETVEDDNSLLFINGYLKNQSSNEDYIKEMTQAAKESRSFATAYAKSMYSNNPMLTPQQHLAELYTKEVNKKGLLEQKGGQEIVKIKYKRPSEQLKTLGYTLSKNGFTPDKDDNINISLYDLNRIGVNSRTFTGWLDELLTSNQISKEDVRKMQAYEEEYEEVDASVLGMYSALYLSKDVVDIEKAEITSPIESAKLLAQEAGKATLQRYFDYSIEESDKAVGGTYRSEISRFENVINNYNESEAVRSGKVQPMKLSTEQEEQIFKTLTEETIEGVGGFVPMLAEFAAVNAVTGGLMSYGALGRTMAALSKGSAFDKMMFHTAQATLEEAKMQGIFGFDPGAGASFYAGGALSSKIPLFGGNFSVFNPLIKKVLMTGPVGAASAEAGEVLKFAYDDLMDNADFKSEFDKHYGDFDDVTRRVLVNSLVFGLTGITHLKKGNLSKGVVGDFATISDISKAIKDIEKQIAEVANERIEKPKRTKGKSLEDLGELVETSGPSDYKKQVDEYNKKVAKQKEKISALVGIQLNLVKESNIRVFATELSPNNPNFENNLQTMVVNPVAKGIQSIVPDYPGIELKFIDSKENPSQRDVFVDKKATAEFQQKGEKEKDVIIIDKAQYGVGKPIHELTHAAMMSQFKHNPYLKQKFGEKMFKIFENEDLISLGLDNLDSRIIKVYGEKDANGKIKLDLRNPKNQEKLFDEYFAFMAEIMANPDIYYSNPKLAGTFLGEAKLEVKNMLIEMGLKSPTPKTARDVIELFALLGKESRMGGKIEKKASALVELEKINILDYKLKEPTLQQILDRMPSTRTPSTSKKGQAVVVDKKQSRSSRDLTEKEGKEIDDILKERITSRSLRRLQFLAKENVFDVTNKLGDKVSKKDAIDFVPELWENEIDRIAKSSGYAFNPKFEEIKDDLILSVKYDGSQSVKGLVKAWKPELGMLSKYIGQNLNRKLVYQVKNNYPELITPEDQLTETREVGKTQAIETASEGSVDLAEDVARAAVRAEQEDIKRVDDKDLVDPRSFLPKDFVDKFEVEATEKIAQLGSELENATYGKLKFLTSSSTAELFGVRETTVVDPSQNMSSSEINRFQDKFIEIAKEKGGGDISKGLKTMADVLLPFQTVPEVLVTQALSKDVATSKLSGTSTNVPNNMLRVFYEKIDRVKTGPGVPEWIKKQDITAQQFAEAFGFNADGTKKTKNPRDKIISDGKSTSLGSNVQGIMSLFERNLGNKITREFLEEVAKVHPEYVRVIEDIGIGKSVAMSSRDLKLNNKPFSKEDWLYSGRNVKMEVLRENPVFFSKVFDYANRSIREYDLIIEKYPSEDKAFIGKNLEIKDKAYYNRGMAKATIGDYKGALEDLKSAEKLYSSTKMPGDYFGFYGNMANIKFQLGDLDGAFSDLNKMKKTFHEPPLTGFVNKKGSLEELEMRSLEKSNIQRKIGQDLYYLLGRIYLEKGEYELAVEHLKSSHFRGNTFDFDRAFEKLEEKDADDMSKFTGESTFKAEPDFGAKGKDAPDPKVPLYLSKAYNALARTIPQKGKYISGGTFLTRKNANDLSQQEFKTYLNAVDYRKGEKFYNPEIIDDAIRTENKFFKEIGGKEFDNLDIEFIDDAIYKLENEQDLLDKALFKSITGVKEVNFDYFQNSFDHKLSAINIADKLIENPNSRASLDLGGESSRQYKIDFPDNKVLKYNGTKILGKDFLDIKDPYKKLDIVFQNEDLFKETIKVYNKELEYYNSFATKNKRTKIDFDKEYAKTNEEAIANTPKTKFPGIIESFNTRIEIEKLDGVIKKLYKENDFLEKGELIKKNIVENNPDLISLASRTLKDPNENNMFDFLSNYSRAKERKQANDKIKDLAKDQIRLTRSSKDLDPEAEKRKKKALEAFLGKVEAKKDKKTIEEQMMESGSKFVAKSKTTKKEDKKGKSNWDTKKEVEKQNKKDKDFYEALRERDEDTVGPIKGNSMKRFLTTGADGATTMEVAEQIEKIDKANQKLRELENTENSKIFNDIIKKKEGVSFDQEFSKADAIERGKKKNDLLGFWLPSSAEDFKGLLYRTLPKGKFGEAAFEFYKDTLMKPFARAERDINRYTVALSNDYKELKKTLKVNSNYLAKKNATGFTNETAVRAYMFHMGGHTIPGFEPRNLKETINHVTKDPSLLSLAENIMKITKSKTYTKPTESWQKGSIQTDMYNLTRKEIRQRYLKEFTKNAKEIFNERNLSKLEALYGQSYRVSLEKMVTSMVEGRKRPYKNDAENKVYDYINGSTAAIMFYNTKSAALQTISAVNYVNWTFNNPVAAADAMVRNPKQWMKDWNDLFNSSHLVARRKGLKINLSEAELADKGTGAGSKVTSIISALLKKGYYPTQIADSVAIATGGASYYRNRVNDLIKNEKLDKETAEKQAFEEFVEISEESQQSSRTDKISAQQGSAIGRMVLAFANTPMQYARLSKRAAQDIINGRGDLKSNLSKIVYYTFVQNAVFSFIQNGMFKLLFSDEEEGVTDDDIKIVNSMTNNILRGLGIFGATAAMVKDVALAAYKQSNKKRPDYSKIRKEILNIAPAIDSKWSKFGAFSDALTYGSYSSIDSAIYPTAQLLTAATNLPLDRLVSKLNNLEGAVFGNYQNWQRIAMSLGYPDWTINAEDLDSNRDIMEFADDWQFDAMPKKKTKSTVSNNVRTREARTRDPKTREARTRDTKTRN